MREIKFRAWDGEKMLYPGVNGHVAIGAVSWGFWDNNHALLADSDSPYCELLQSTGLKDVDGTEIYEGDIIQSPGNFGIIKKYKVVWSCLCFTLKYLEGINKGKLDGFLDTWSKCKVIGNIYENPELLED